jgi:hypothetical protein
MYPSLVEVEIEKNSLEDRGKERGKEEDEDGCECEE